MQVCTHFTCYLVAATYVKSVVLANKMKHVAVNNVIYRRRIK